MNLRTRVERLEQHKDPPGIMCIEISVGDEVAPFGHVAGQRYDQRADELLDEFEARLRAVAAEKDVAYFIVGGLEPPRQSPGDDDL